MFFERNVQGETETVMAAGAEKKVWKISEILREIQCAY